MIHLFAFTDPVCVWCWASEAPLRGLETHYAGQLFLHHIAGGMIKDIQDFYDPQAGLVGHQTFEEINRNIAHHYEESAQSHRMPIMTRGFSLFSEDMATSWPQNIAFKAAQLATPEHADRFLRRIRQSTMAEARRTGEAPVLYELARESGIDLKKYAQALTDGSARNAFEDDLRVGAEAGVDLFPTFILTYQDKSMRLSGFVPYANFVKAITQLTGGAIKPQPSPPEEAALNRLLEKYQTLSREEIRQAFDFEDEKAADAWVSGLREAGKLKGDAFIQSA